MSGNNPQGGQGGQQSPQGGQQRGGNQQAGQPPQGGQPRGGQQPRGQPPQGGAPPQQTGGGGGGTDTGAIKNVALWGIVVFALAGLALGLVPLLFGFAGDFNDTVESTDANSTLQSAEDKQTAEANSIISDALSDDNASAAAAYDQMQSQNSLIENIIFIAPFLGILFALVVGLLVGLRSDAETKRLAAGVAISTVVGLLLFVLLSSAIAGFQYNSMDNQDWIDEYNTNPQDWNGPGGYPSSDIDEGVQEEFNEATVDTEVGERTVRPSNADISQPRQIRGLRLDYGTMFINTLLMGLLTALAAAGLAVSSQRLSEKVE